MENQKCMFYFKMEDGALGMNWECAAQRVEQVPRFTKFFTKNS